jgi:hypothetical protein
MRRRVLVPSFLAVLLFVPLVGADLVRPQPYAPEQKIGGMSVRSYPRQFKPNESALVHLYGTGDATLLLYVFDPQGNCVAWDDNVTEPQFCDELAAEWIADSTGRYSVEVRNAGVSAHSFSLAIR